MGSPREYLLGVDIGTSSSKGVLVDGNTGEVLAFHEVEHDLSMPMPGWVEHDPDKIWWGEFVTICRELISATAIDPRDIKGVGTSGIGPCVLPIDESGHPLRAAILYGIDTRARQEIEIYEKELGKEAIFQLSGSNLSSSAVGPKILWIRHHEPQVYARARWFLTSQSYLVFKLTGRATVDIYSACSYAPLMDVEQCQWVDREVAGINPNRMLPDLLRSCDIAGQVTAEAARLTGLTEGTPVIAGTIDAAAEAISAGLSDFGDMMMMIGSSNSLIVKTNKLVRTQNFWGLQWLEPGTFAVVGGMATAGSLTRWFRDNFGQVELAQQRTGGRNAYAALSDLLQESPAGARGLIALPYFKGERTPLNDPDAKGMLFGLTLKHTRADVYRALLESVGFGVRHNMDEMLAEGVKTERILGVGGGTKNKTWMQIICDIANVSIWIPEKQIGASYGDAFMAGVGIGLFTNLSQIKQWVKPKIAIHPRADVHQNYEESYSIYRDLYLSNRYLMHRVSSI